MVFSDETKILIGAVDNKGKFIWGLQNIKESENCSNFLLKLPALIMILGCMSKKSVCCELEWEFKEICFSFRRFSDSLFRRSIWKQ